MADRRLQSVVTQPDRAGRALEVVLADRDGDVGWYALVHADPPVASTWHGVAELRALAAVADGAVTIAPDIAVAAVDERLRTVAVTVTAADGTAATVVTDADGVANTARVHAERAVVEVRRLRSEG